MSEESYASIYAKAVREARQQERGMDEARRSRQLAHDRAEKYKHGSKPPVGYRVYKGSSGLWAAETSAWGRSLDDVWGDWFYARPAAVNAAWEHSNSHGTAGGKQRHAPKKMTAKKSPKRKRTLSPAAAREFRKLSRMLGR
jgi:hypothetical protein